MKKYKAVYFVAVGGAAVLISKRIKRVETIAYEDLGPEAIYRLEVEDFPLIVANDVYGNDLFDEGIKKYRKFT
jgi:fumarate hydratase subunit beta